LASLRAAEEMAKLQNDFISAQQYRNRFELSSTNYDLLCWGGDFYINTGFNPGWNAYGDGVLTDHLLGQWWAHILDLGYILPKDHVSLSISSIFQYNHQIGFNTKDEGPRIFMDSRDSGLWICRWPNGNEPPNPILYNSECWSGTEYPVAALLLYEGNIAAGQTVINDIRSRQDGTRRSPWNELECGDRYSRPQSSFSLLDAASGYHYNAPAHSMKFNPIFTPSQFQCFIITESGWGSYSQNSPEDSLPSGTVTISVVYGNMSLQQISIVCTALHATVLLNGNQISSVVNPINGGLVIVFPLQTIQTNSSLTVQLAP